MSQQKYCPKCNASYDEEVKFCHEDGTPLQETTDPTAISEEERAKELRAAKELAKEVQNTELPSARAEDEFTGVEVPNLKAFIRLSDEFREQQKTVSTLSRSHKQDSKAVDSLSKRVILIEEEMDRITQELKTLKEKLSRGKDSSTLNQP